MQHASSSVELRPSDEAITNVRIESPQLPLHEALLPAPTFRSAQLPLERDALEHPILLSRGRVHSFDSGHDPNAVKPLARVR